MNPEARFREKVTFLSFLCSILVMILHSSNIVAEDFPRFAVEVEFFFSRIIAQVSVPLFFVMSGFLFYRNFTWSKLLPKLKRRFFTLVIPYLIWNLIGMVVFFFLSRLPFINTEPFSLDFETLVASLVFYRYNGNFWFMLYLIVITYLFPLIYPLYRNKWVGLGVNIAMLVFYCLGGTIFTGRIGHSLIYFSTGVWLATHFEKQVVEANRFHWTGILSLAGGILLVYLFTFETWAYIPARMLLIYGLFQLVNLLPNIRVPLFLQCSFPIYAMHGIVLETFNKLFSFILPMDTSWVLVDYFLSPALSLAVIASFVWFLEKRFPRVNTLLFGNR